MKHQGFKMLKEDFEYVAKAFGMKDFHFQDKCEYYKEWGIMPSWGVGHDEFWNPLQNSGDAFSVAIKLGMEVSVPKMEVSFKIGKCATFKIKIKQGDDLEQNVRTAIFKAAVKIGKAKESEQNGEKS